ncbi:MAG: tetratricopeptide repeat protein, partial [Synechococcus sp.]
MAYEQGNPAAGLLSAPQPGLGVNASRASSESVLTAAADRGWLAQKPAASVPANAELEQLIRQADALEARGAYAQAEPLRLQILAITEKTNGPEHPFTASSLNIKDEFITNSLFGAATTPQFEGGGGFIKVLEGAKITADSQGRVMLIAPTVVNKGTISAPDGQVI